jgi:protein-tyrosine kinase
MTKVFEALELEQTGEMRKPAPPAPVLIPNAQKPPPQGKGSRLDIEEPMMTLYRNISSALPDSCGKIVQFVASRQGEGTSTIVRELARVAAIKFGKSVVVLDANRAKPVQHHFFGLSPEETLEDALLNGGSTDKALCQYSHSSLFIALLCGESGSVADVFDSPAAGALLDTLRQRFDLVLVDSPAIISSSDCLAICGKVDGVVLVVEADNTRWPVAEATKEGITKAGGNVLGMVLNKREYYIPEAIYRRL